VVDEVPPASIHIAMSASMNATPRCSAIAPPKALRSFAYGSGVERAHGAATPSEPMPMRPPSSVFMKFAKPTPT
jgi:hypothetical protein